MARLKTMTVGEEVFIIVRELRRGQLARWKDFRRAWLEVSGGGRHGANMTVANFLRGQRAGGTIKWVSRGRYAFLKSRPHRPMYMDAGVARIKGVINAGK